MKHALADTPVAEEALGVHLPKKVLSCIGKDKGAFEESIHARVEELLAQKTFSREDITFVKSFVLPAASGTLQVSDEMLERLRRVAQIWDVSLKNKEITSHRKVIGPVIVSIKKMIYPVLSFFLADTLRQQRDFNAAVLRCLVELSQDDTHTDRH